MKKDTVHPLRQMFVLTKEETRTEHILAAVALVSGMLRDSTQNIFKTIISPEATVRAKKAFDYGDLIVQQSYIDVDDGAIDAVYFVNIGKMEFYKDGRVKFVPDFCGMSYSLIKQLKTKLGAVESGKVYHMDADALGGFDRLVANLLGIDAITYKLVHETNVDETYLEHLRKMCNSSYTDLMTMVVKRNKVYTDSYSDETFKFLVTRSLFQEPMLLDYNTAVIS